MKKIIITLSLIVLTGIGIGIYFLIQKQPSTEISLMHDVTDLEMAKPEANQIIPLFGLSLNKWAGAKFKLQNITDVSFNPVREVSIEPANDWFSNEFDRDRDVKGFIGQVKQTLIDSTQDKIGRMHSSVYLPIAKELNLLSQSSAQRRILIIFSDLAENEPNFSFYNKQTFSLLKNDPDKVKDHFEAEQPLGDLDGIEVHLVYQPKDAGADLEYQLISGFYKALLESAGAKVTITANLSN